MPPKRNADRINGAAHRALRERSGYNISQYVRQLWQQVPDIRVNAQHISNIEMGSRNPSPQLIDAMAHVLNVPKAALLRCPGCPGCREVSDDGTCPVCEAVAATRVELVGRAA